MAFDTSNEPGPEAVEEARKVAEAASWQADVQVRAVEDVAGLRAVAAFFADVWQVSEADQPFHPEMLRSLAHSGGEVLAAFSGAELVGATAAVSGPPRQRSIYSLVAGARTSDRGVGYALKQAQRASALERGATSMFWTFDPLVARNARFNLAKLGAFAAEYLVDFYGPMSDGLNGDDESDRLTAHWDLLAHAGDSAPDGVRTAARVTHRAPDGGPLAVRDGDVISCRVPDDVVALRHEDPAGALAWRRAVREVFTAAFADGYVATGMSRDGWYRLTAPGDR